MRGPLAMPLSAGLRADQGHGGATVREVLGRVLTAQALHGQRARLLAAAPDDAQVIRRTFARERDPL